MNKIRAFSNRLQTFEDILPLKCVQNESDVKDSNSALFDSIFGLDSTTGVPTGDLSVYLGDKANPDIRYFIERNLMQENLAPDGLSNLPTDVTNKFRSLSDDDIAFFSRSKNESKEDYANRLRVFFANERAKRAEERKQKTIDKLLNGDAS